MTQAHQKVTAGHLRRDAYLYVRQSTIRQVFENTESTRRQYALRDRAVSMGWPIERVVVIDTDQGKSGGAGTDREGFQRLVGDVGMGRAGIVLGLEVSRLARNSTDWHRLLEICALTDTLILDEDSLGTLFKLPVAETSSDALFPYLAEHNIPIVATSPDAEKSLWEVDLSGPVALAIGSEQLGLESRWLAEADVRIRIPMQGESDSLNAATATSVALFEVVRQRTMGRMPNEV